MIFFFKFVIPLAEITFVSNLRQIFPKRVGAAAACVKGPPPGRLAFDDRALRALFPNFHWMTMTNMPTCMLSIYSINSMSSEA